jgi:hypothetical protein
MGSSTIYHSTSLVYGIGNGDKNLEGKAGGEFVFDRRVTRQGLYRTLPLWGRSYSNILKQNKCHMRANLYYDKSQIVTLLRNLL